MYLYASSVRNIVCIGGSETICSGITQNTTAIKVILHFDPEKGPNGLDKKEAVNNLYHFLGEID